MASQNPDLIMEAMAAYKDNNVPDPKSELKKAQEMLDYMRVSEGMYYVIKEQYSETWTTDWHSTMQPEH